MSTLTLERAQELLKTLPVVRVRTWQDGGNREHAGRAILLRLQGEQAVIKPHTHGKEEIVPLSQISEWKSGNHFYEQRKPMKPQKLTQREMTLLAGTAGGIEPAQKDFAPLSTKFIIADRENRRFYGGPTQRWVNDVSKALVHKTKGDADRAVHHLHRSDDAKHVEVVARDVAVGLSSQWNSGNVAVKPENPADTLETPITSSMSPESFHASKEIVAPITGEKNSDSILSSLISIDLDAIENDDGSDLIAAINARKKAASDLKEARALLIDAYQRFDETQQAYGNLIQRFAPKAKTSEKVVPANNRPAKGAAAPLIKGFLGSSGKASSGEIVKYMIDLGIYDNTKNPASSCRQAIYKLERQKEIVKTSNGMFKLA